MRAGVHLILILIALCVFSNCLVPYVPETREPDAVIALWRDALVQGRPGDAFALLHPEAREGMDEAAFVLFYERQRTLLVSQANALLQSISQGVAVEQARVELGDQEVLLERRGGRWLLLAPVRRLTEDVE